jgi:hypothetical protein
VYFDFTSETAGANFAVGWLLGVQSIPEPSTASLVALGLCVLVAWRGRRGTSGSRLRAPRTPRTGTGAACAGC